MLTRIHAKLSGWAHSDEGATAVEYGIMVGLIAVAIIVTVGVLGGQLNTLFQNVSTTLSNVAPTTP